MYPTVLYCTIVAATMEGPAPCDTIEALIRIVQLAAYVVALATSLLQLYGLWLETRNRHDDQS